MAFETPHRKQERYTRPHKPLEHLPDSESMGQHEALQNIVFEQYIRQQLIDDFFEKMDEYDFTDDQVHEMQNAVSQLDDGGVLATISLPFGLRQQWYARTEKDVREGKIAPADAIRRLAQVGEENGFTIGYHTSPVDILPDAEGRWEIKGTEKDHRDDDIAMSYYSNQYRHLFKRKDPKFIYVVRADKSHRTDGNWNRAPSLSVITRLPFAEVYNYVETVVRDLERKNDPSDRMSNGS